VKKPNRLVEQLTSANNSRCASNWLKMRGKTKSRKPRGGRGEGIERKEGAALQHHLAVELPAGQCHLRLLFCVFSLGRRKQGHVYDSARPFVSPNEGLQRVKKLVVTSVLLSTPPAAPVTEVEGNVLMAGSKLVAVPVESFNGATVALFLVHDRPPRDFDGPCL
jgi:hypothetical protein